MSTSWVNGNLLENILSLPLKIWLVLEPGFGRDTSQGVCGVSCSSDPLQRLEITHGLQAFLPTNPHCPPNPSPPPRHTHILIGEEVVIFWRCWNPDPSLLWKPRWHFKVGGPYTFLLGGRKANCIFLVALGFFQTQGSITNPRLSGFDGTDLHVKQALTSAWLDFPHPVPLNLRSSFCRHTRLTKGIPPVSDAPIAS